MDLYILENFITIAREQNITKASEILHLAQPTLSRQLSQLEEELAVKLFFRGKQMTLTEQGTIFRQYAEEVLQLTEAMEGRLKSDADLSGSLSIGVGGQFSSSGLPEMIAAFQQRYPKIQIDFFSNSTDIIQNRINSGLLDLALFLEPIDATKYDFITLPYEDRWGLLVQSSHPYAARDHVQLSDLLDMPLIITNRKFIHKKLNSWFGEDFHKLHIVMTYDIVTNVAALILAGNASAITVESATALLSREKFAFIPLEPGLTMKSALVWKKYTPVTGIKSLFLNFTNQWFS